MNCTYFAASPTGKAVDADSRGLRLPGLLGNSTKQGGVLLSSSTFPGPVPPENNPPINPQYYKPRQYFISALTLGPTTTVTTTVPNDYVVGQLVRILIPFGYGTYQISGQEGYVLSIPAPDQVVVSINSTNYDAFNNSFTSNLTLPQIIAIGDIANGVTNSQGRINNGTAIPGSFQNISPQ